MLQKIRLANPNPTYRCTEIYRIHLTGKHEHLYFCAEGIIRASNCIGGRYPALCVAAMQRIGEPWHQPGHLRVTHHSPSSAPKFIQEIMKEIMCGVEWSDWRH